MLLYQGDIQRVNKLVCFSKHFNSTKNTSYKELHKFLQAIELNHLHSLKSEETRVNILNQLYLSSEKRENKILIDEMIFMICNSVVQTNGVSIDPRITVDNNNSHRRFKEEYYKLTSIIRDICSNKWDFVWKLEKDDQYKKAFCSLFDLNLKTFDFIQVLSILKPEVTGLVGNPKVNNYLTNAQLNKFNKKIQDFGINLNEEEQLQMKMLIIITNKSLPHLVDLLNDFIENQKVTFLYFKFIYLILIDMIYSNQFPSKIKFFSLLLRNYYFYLKKNSKGGDSRSLDDSSNADREELAIILQSILLSKHATQLNWYQIYQDLKTNNGKGFTRILNLDQEKYLSKINKLSSCIIHSFDSISAVFLADLNNDVTESVDNRSFKHSLSSRTSDFKKRLIDFSKIQQFQRFDLNFFLLLDHVKQQQVFTKSSLVLQYLQKTQQISNQLSGNGNPIQSRFTGPNQLSKSRFISKDQKSHKTFKANNTVIISKYTCQKLTSLVFGSPFNKLSKYNRVIYLMKKAAKIFIKNDLKQYEKLIEVNEIVLQQNKIKTFDEMNLVLFQKLFEFFYLCFYSNELSEKSKNGLFNNQINCIKGFSEVCLIKKLGSNSEISKDQKEQEFINQIIQVIGGKNLKQSYQNLQDIFLKYQKLYYFLYQCKQFTSLLIGGFSEIGNYFDNRKLQKIYKRLQILLDRPLINFEDKHTLNDLLLLLKCIDDKYIDRNLVRNTIKVIVNGDYNSLLQIIEYSALIPPNDLKIVKESISKISNLSVFKSRGQKSEVNSNYQPVMSDQMKDIVKRIEEGKLSIKDMFHSIDSQGDNNGYVSLAEFCNFLRRTGIQMSEHRSNELFATIIKNRSRSSGRGDESELNYEEFEEAFKYLTSKKTDMSLEILGISPALLALSLGTLIIILILLLVFIFLGIKAFALGGTFGSIINSIIPVAATTGTAQTQNDNEDSLKEDNVKDVVKQTQQILNTNQL